MAGAMGVFFPLDNASFASGGMKMKHAQLLARERFLTSVERKLQPEVDEFNAWRRKHARNAGRKRDLTVGGYIKEKSPTAFGHYKTLRDNVNHAEAPELLPGAWGRLKADFPSLKALEDGFTKTYVPAVRWASTVRQSLEERSFDILRDGISLDLLDEEGAFNYWMERVLKRDEKHFVVDCYAILQGLDKYRGELGLREERDYRMRRFWVCLNMGIKGCEELNKLAWNDAWEQGIVGIYTGEIDNEVDYWGMAMTHILVGTIDRNFGHNDRGNGTKLFWARVGMNTLAMLKECGENLPYVDTMCRGSQLLTEELLRLWLISHDCDENDPSFREAIEQPGCSELYDTWVEWVRGDPVRNGLDDAIQDPVGWSSIRSFGEVLGLASVCLEKKIGLAKVAADMLILSGGKLYDEKFQVSVPAVVDWYDTCAKLFETTGYVGAAGRARQCVKLIYESRNDFEKLGELEEKEMQAIDHRRVCELDIKKEDIEELLDVVKFNELAELVT